MNELAPGSLLVLRLPSALAAAATTVVAALVARELGGGRRAQVIAARAPRRRASRWRSATSSPRPPSTCSARASLGWLLVRAVVRAQRPGAARRWHRRPASGARPSRRSRSSPSSRSACWLSSVRAGRCARGGSRARSWRRPRSRAVRDLAGAHGWPQLTVAGEHRRFGRGRPGRVRSVPARHGQPGAGAGLDRRAAGALAPAGAAATAVPADHATACWRSRTWPATARPTTWRASTRSCSGSARCRPRNGRARSRARRARLGSPSASSCRCLVSAVIALPLLPETTLQGSVVMAINPDQGETVGLAAIHRHRDRGLARAPGGRAGHTPSIFTGNYGEAGAIDLLGRTRACPAPTAATTDSANGGNRRPTPPTLVLGYEDPRRRALVRRLHAAGASSTTASGSTTTNKDCRCMLCRPTASWATLWPQLRQNTRSGPGSGSPGWSGPATRNQPARPRRRR